MSQFTAECLDTFLRNQGQLFRENVAADREEAAEFLEECMAETVSSIGHCPSPLRLIIISVKVEYSYLIPYFSKVFLNHYLI